MSNDPTPEDVAIDDVRDIMRALDTNEGLVVSGDERIAIELAQRSMLVGAAGDQVELTEEIRDILGGIHASLERQAAATEVLARAMAEVLERAKQVQGG